MLSTVATSLKESHATLTSQLKLSKTFLDEEFTEVMRKKLMGIGEYGRQSLEKRRKQVQGNFLFDSEINGV